MRVLRTENSYSDLKVPNAKDKDEPEGKLGAVYKIKCPTTRTLISVRPTET